MLYQLTLYRSIRAVEQQIMLGSGDLVVLLAVVATVQGELLYVAHLDFIYGHCIHSHAEHHTLFKLLMPSDC